MRRFFPLTRPRKFDRFSPVWVIGLVLASTACAQQDQGIVAGQSQAAAQTAVQDPPRAAASQVLADALTRRIEEEMERQGIVGMSVAVVMDGRIIYEKGFGWEDRENQIRASEKTMYRWASISKPVTAVAAMQLWERGDLDLDTSVSYYVPEFPDLGYTITSNQLLCHQGGIVHYRNGEVVSTLREYTSPHPFEDTTMALDKFNQSPLVAEPGTKYSYTTHGYMLLGAVVQRAGKQKFADQVAERIAKPLGMTTFQPDYQWVDIPHSAVGYRRSRGGDVTKSTDTDVSWKLPGGGFISTVGDLARFSIGMLNHKLVERSTRKSMWTRQKTRDGEETNYGLGFQVRGEGDELRVSHGGSQEKTRTHLVMAPNAKDSVAVMCTTDSANPSRLSGPLLDMVLAQKK